jgi:hypothetical protein
MGDFALPDVNLELPAATGATEAAAAPVAGSIAGDAAGGDVAPAAGNAGNPWLTALAPAALMDQMSNMMMLQQQNDQDSAAMNAQAMQAQAAMAMQDADAVHAAGNAEAEAQMSGAVAGLVSGAKVAGQIVNAR